MADKLLRIPRIVRNFNLSLVFVYRTNGSIVNPLFLFILYYPSLLFFYSSFIHVRQLRIVRLNKRQLKANK